MRKYIVIAIVLLVVASCNSTAKQPKYIFNEGSIFGTYYHISYEHPKGIDLYEEVEEELHRLDMSLSTYKTESVLSKVNTNRPVVLDKWFQNVFEKAEEISTITNGAFDATVAPLVNIWGFGFRERESITPMLIDSIKAFVGYKKIKIDNGKVIKDDERTMLDFSAIAKGYAVDVVGDLLAANGCKNYMVEIGGEVVAHGVNNHGNFWRIGINEPNDNEPAVPSNLEAIVSLQNKAVATSGNYRNFYIENGVKYAHTISPATGFPVSHSLLSASVLADNCMTADAFATAFMVLGVEKTQELVSNLNGIDVLLIYDDGSGENQIVMTKGFSEFIIEN